MPNLGNIIKISKTDYDALLSAYPSSTTIGGVSRTYDPNSIYLVDEAPTLLWTNTAPSTTFSSGNVTLSQSCANFKYLVFEYKEYINDLTTVFKVIRTPLTYASSTTGQDGVGVRLDFCFKYQNPETNPVIPTSRTGFITNSTTVYFTDARLNVTTTYTTSPATSGLNNDCSIPIAIYGKNSL